MRKICNINPTKVFTNEKSSTPTGLAWYTSMSKCACRFNGSGCSPKAKAIQSRFHKENNYPSFGNRSTSSHIPTEQATFPPESLLILRTSSSKIMSAFDTCDITQIAVRC